MLGDFGEQVQTFFAGQLGDFDFKPSADDAQPIAVVGAEEGFHFVGWDARQAFDGFGEFIELEVERVEFALRGVAFEFAQFFHERQPSDAELRTAVALCGLGRIARVRIDVEGVQEHGDFHGA